MTNGFAKNVASTFISRILIIGMGLVASIIVARTLGPAGKGIFAALGAMVGIALQFGNLGLHGANVYFTAKDKSKALSLTGNSFWFSLIIGLVLFFSFYLFLFQHPGALGNIDIRLAIITLIAVPFMLLAYLWQNILVGLNKIKAYNWILISNQILSLIGAFAILLVFKRGIFPLIVFNTLTTIVIACFYGTYLFKIQQFSLRFDWDLAKKSLNYGFKIYLSCFFAYLVLRSDLFILNYFRGTTETGLYSIAANFVDGIILLPSIIALFLLPKAVENLGQSGELIAKTARISFIIIGVICLGAVILGRPAINLMFGFVFDQIFIPLLILIPGAFFFALEVILVQYFSAHNRLLPTIYFWIIAVVLNVGLNIVFIPTYGMIAAAASSLLSYFLVFILVANLFIKHSGLEIKSILPQKEDWISLSNLVKTNFSRKKVIKNY